MSFVLSFISLISTAEVQCSASPSPSDSALPLVGILRALHKHAMIHDSHFAARRHTQPHIVRLCDLFKEWIGKGLRLQQVRHLKQELVGVLKPEEVPRNCWYVWTMRARDSDRERQTEIERESTPILPICTLEFSICFCGLKSIIGQYHIFCLPESARTLDWGSGCSICKTLPSSASSAQRRDRIELQQRRLRENYLCSLKTQNLNW